MGLSVASRSDPDRLHSIQSRQRRHEIPFLIDRRMKDPINPGCYFGRDRGGAGTNQITKKYKKIQKKPDLEPADGTTAADDS